MLRSTQTSSTRPCRLRFVNNSEHPVDVFWITYEGTEQSYASVPPNSQHVQGASMSLCTKTSSVINLKYATMKSFNVFLCCLLVLLAATFTTHPWTVRSSNSKDLLGHYVGDNAVLEVVSNSTCTVHSGAAKHICPRPVPTPVHWGAYHQRCTIKGIAIMVRMLALAHNPQRNARSPC